MFFIIFMMLLFVKLFFLFILALSPFLIPPSLLSLSLILLLLLSSTAGGDSEIRGRERGRDWRSDDRLLSLTIGWFVVEGFLDPPSLTGIFSTIAIKSGTFLMQSNSLSSLIPNRIPRFFLFSCNRTIFLLFTTSITSSSIVRVGNNL